jgi:hypothetical protein
MQQLFKQKKIRRQKGQLRKRKKKKEQILQIYV